MSVALQSISVLQFGPDNILFVGDSKQACIFAFDLGISNTVEESNGFNILGIDKKIAGLLGVSVDEIIIKDFAIHPHTKEAYIALHRGHGKNSIPLIIKASQRGDLAVLSLEKMKYSQCFLKNPIHPQVVLWNQVDARTLAITDLVYHEGALFITGLSNADFSSTLYRISYPFLDQVSTSSVEMYHAVHDQNETRAPIETMAIIKLNGQPHILAAYTCTPLVTIPLDKFKDGGHIIGKTIGELGYGNTPIDILPFQVYDFHHNTYQDVILITHKNRGAMLFTVEAIEKSNLQEGLYQKAAFGEVKAPEHWEPPLAGVLHADNQDKKYLAALRRDPETGRLDLISFIKGLHFRLGDFVSEYMLPGYHLSPEVSQFSNMMKESEGFIV